MERPDHRGAKSALAAPDESIADIREMKREIIGRYSVTALGSGAIAAAIAAVPAGTALPLMSLIGSESSYTLPATAGWLIVAAGGLLVSYELARSAAAHARVAFKTIFARPEKAISKWEDESNRYDRAPGGLSDDDLFRHYETRAGYASLISKQIICANEMLAIAKRSEDPRRRAELIIRLFHSAPQIVTAGVMQRAAAQLLDVVPEWASSPDKKVRADCTKQLESVADAVAACSADLRERTVSVLMELGSELIHEAPRETHRLYRKALELTSRSMVSTRYTIEEALIGLLNAPLRPDEKVDVALDVLKFKGDGSPLQRKIEVGQSSHPLLSSFPLACAVELAAETKSVLVYPPVNTKTGDKLRDITISSSGPAFSRPDS